MEFMIAEAEEEENKNSTDLVDDFWEEVNDANLVHHLTGSNWFDFVRSNPYTMITVYSPECPICRSIREELVACVKLLRKNNVPGEMAAINGDIYEVDILSFWKAEIGVPSLFWFEKGKLMTEYKDVRRSRDILDFIKKHSPQFIEDILRCASPLALFEKLRECLRRIVFATGPIKVPSKTSIADWSTLEAADVIYHLEDDGFASFLKDNDEVLIFFYSQENEQCTKIQPLYEEAAEKLDEKNPSATLAAVNVKKSPTTAHKYHVTDTPAFLYFKNGKFRFRFTAQPTMRNIVDFMIKPVFNKPPVEGDEGPKSNLTVLFEDTFDDFVKESKEALIMFHAPWCGHCRRFKPQFQKAADEIMLLDNTKRLATLNAANTKELNKKFNVHGFPMLLHFKDHAFVKIYDGKRSKEGIIKYLLGEEKVVDGFANTAPEGVVILQPKNFNETVQSIDFMFVMFYAPWCSACKKAKSDFFDIHDEITEELPDTKIGIFNADEHKEFAKEANITKFPTFWLYKKGNKLFEYFGDKELGSFVDFIENPVKMDPPKTSRKQWATEESEVKHLTRENFDSFIRTNRHVMVFYYINACDFCFEKLKPKYERAANELARLESKSKLAALNCDWEKEICAKHKVQSFPTLLYFRSGRMQYPYESSTEHSDIVKFMQNPKEETAKKDKPISWQDIVPISYGKVEQLSNETMDTFLKEKKISLIMFHSLYSKRCEAIREEFRKAADVIFKSDASQHIGLGAIDCHRHSKQGVICYKLGVRKFPSFKLFRFGEYVEDIEGNKEEHFVNIVKNELKKIKNKDWKRKKEEL